MNNNKINEEKIFEIADATFSSVDVQVTYNITINWRCPICESENFEDFEDELHNVECFECDSKFELEMPLYIGEDIANDCWYENGDMVDTFELKLIEEDE